MFSKGLISLLLASLVSAQRQLPFGASGNNYGLWMTFSPDFWGCTTPYNATDVGVSLHVAINQTAADMVCVNLDDLFATSNNASTKTGNANNSYLFADPDFQRESPKPIPASVNWTSYNGNRYRPELNYTNVFYYQQNYSGSIGSGELGQLGVGVYPFVNCSFELGVANRTTARLYDCQEPPSGQCNEAYAVKSVGFFPVNQTSDSCYTWREWPSSGQRAYSGAGMVIGGAGVLAGLMMLL